MALLLQHITDLHSKRVSKSTKRRIDSESDEEPNLASEYTVPFDPEVKDESEKGHLSCGVSYLLLIFQPVIKNLLL